MAWTARGALAAAWLALVAAGACGRSALDDGASDAVAAIPGDASADAPTEKVSSCAVPTGAAHDDEFGCGPLPPEMQNGCGCLCSVATPLCVDGAWTCNGQTPRLLCNGCPTDCIIP